MKLNLSISVLSDLIMSNEGSHSKEREDLLFAFNGGTAIHKKTKFT